MNHSTTQVDEMFDISLSSKRAISKTDALFFLSLWKVV